MQIRKIEDYIEVEKLVDVLLIIFIEHFEVGLLDWLIFWRKNYSNKQQAKLRKIASHDGVYVHPIPIQAIHY